MLTDSENGDIFMKKDKIMMISMILFSANLQAEQTQISITAIQKGDQLTYIIRNLSSNLLFLSNPEYVGLPVRWERGKDFGNYDAFAKTHNRPSKHIVVLSPKADDMMHNWAFTFSSKSHRDVKGMTKMEISLWTASEEDYLKNPITSLKHEKFPVIIAPPQSGE